MTSGRRGQGQDKKVIQKNTQVKDKEKESNKTISGECRNNARAEIRNREEKCVRSAIEDNAMDAQSKTS